MLSPDPRLEIVEHIISAPQGDDADDDMATQNPKNDDDNLDDDDEKDPVLLGVAKVGDILSHSLTC